MRRAPSWRPTGGALARRSSAPTARPALLVPLGRPARSAASLLGCSSDARPAAAASARRAAPGARPVHLAQDRRGHGRATTASCSTRAADAAALMLTGRLRPARPRERATACSTSAAAAAGTLRASRCGGATVVALDFRRRRAQGAAAVRAARCWRGGRARRTAPAGGMVNGDALRPAVPGRRRSTASSSSEVLEHLWDDERDDRRARPGAAARRPHGGHRPDPLARARLLGARLPTTTTRPAAHVRIYRQHELGGEARAGRACVLRARTTPHAPALAVLVAEVRGRASTTPGARPVRKYHDFLVGT